MKKLKGSFLIIFTLILTLVFFITGCSTEKVENIQDGENQNTGDATTTTESAVTDSSITAEETTAEFSITTSDGVFSQNENIYTITHSGTYSLTGGLTGQIVVNNTDKNDADDIILELNGTTIQYSQDSPIKITSKINDVEISAKNGTGNIIKDTRSARINDDDNQGNGAIYSKADLKLKGKGTLIVEGGYNNGVHTTKDLKIQNLSLKVTAYNNAIKGNKSITVSKGGKIVAISTNGDGIKTDDNDTDEGNIIIEAGNIAVYSAGDGIQSAKNFTLKSGVDDDENVTTPILSIFTGSYSGYTSNSATTDSYKGIKVENELNIEAGALNLKTYDDGLHANYGEKFKDSTTGQGTINISGGEITAVLYSTTKTTGGGRQGPRGFENQQTITGAKGIHADYKLTISGGKIDIDSAFEGLEANQITISGGETSICANDDGINASTKEGLSLSTPAINVSGGYLDVTVSPNGDTDGIDSNGTYTQTGGIVIARGPNSQNMSALDSDGNATITGGTVIILGYSKINGSSLSTYNLSLHASGSHTIKINGTSYTFTNKYSYGKTTVYSSVSVTA